jgi:polyisoprenoid-binding protein YceI
MRRTLYLERWFRFLLVSSAVLSAPVGAQTEQPLADAELRSGTLSFVGHATGGDFVGSTTTVSGAVTGDGAPTRGWVEAPVATLVTHNQRRDRDLQASMEVDRYPTMRFDLLGATTVSSGNDQSDTLTVLLRGNLAVHGVTHAVDLQATVARTADTVHVTAAFPLDLADYHIGGLSKAFGLLRMQRQIEVRVDLRFVSASRYTRVTP